MKPIRAVSVALLVMAVGCTDTLEVRKLDWNAPGVGYPYPLPYTQFDVTLNWRVIACTTDADPLKVKLSATFKAKDTLPVDPAYTFMVNPIPLQGLFRTTDFQIEYDDNRYVKSINSAVNDQTGEAIASILATVATLAPVALGIPAGPTRTPACPDTIAAALRAIEGSGNKPGQEDLTKQAEKDVTAQTAVVTRLTAVLAAATGPDRLRARRDLAAAEARLAALTLRHNAQSSELQRLVQILSDTRTITWPTSSTEFATAEPERPSRGAMTRWGADPGAKGLQLYLRLKPIPGQVSPAMIKDDTADRTLARTTAEGSSGGRTSIPPLDAMPGLPYREPRPMIIELCSAQPCEEAPSGTPVASEEVRVFQGGPLMFLPFNARTFADIKSGATFKNAVLASGGTSQVRGAGSGAAQAAEKAAGSIASAASAIKGADLKRLQAERNELVARKAVTDARAALTPDANAEKQAAIKAFEVDATLAQTELTMIQAEQALAEAKRQRSEP